MKKCIPNQGLPRTNPRKNRDSKGFGKPEGRRPDMMLGKKLSK